MASNGRGNKKKIEEIKAHQQSVDSMTAKTSSAKLSDSRIKHWGNEADGK
jgi:hypothetical protein